MRMVFLSASDQPDVLLFESLIDVLIENEQPLL